MEGFLSERAAIDVALVALAIELALLIAWRSRAREGLRPLDVIGQLAAGGLLLGALRCAVVEADPRLTLGLLAASFPAHLFDLIRRARIAGRVRRVAD